MNIQAMMKQAQKMQKDMMKQKQEIDDATFEGKSSFVTITMKGNREVTGVKIDVDSLEKDEIEILEDIILVAVNDANKQIEDMTEKKLGQYTKGMPGLF